MDDPQQDVRYFDSLSLSEDAALSAEEVKLRTHYVRATFLGPRALMAEVLGPTGVEEVALFQEALSPGQIAEINERYPDATLRLVRRSADGRVEDVSFLDATGTLLRSERSTFDVGGALVEELEFDAVGALQVRRTFENDADGELVCAREFDSLGRQIDEFRP